MKICIFGGTFDPPHIGHLLIAQTVCEVEDFDKILFVPAYSPPHKVQITDIEPVYIQGGVAILTFVIFGLIGYHFIGRRPKFVDFMIATEGEMRKVNWSTRREIVGSTILVILLTLFIALFCQVVDLLFSWFFQWVDVLQSV
ncbi:MAG: preprotein translocase subunit SecE [Phycisphaerae bacterium]|nr:preprotein translocase subunit SecE [Phycisphaerae bacterium]